MPVRQWTCISLTSRLYNFWITFCVLIFRTTSDFETFALAITDSVSSSSEDSSLSESDEQEEMYSALWNNRLIASGPQSNENFWLSLEIFKLKFWYQSLSFAAIIITWTIFIIVSRDNFLFDSLVACLISTAQSYTIEALCFSLAEPSNNNMDRKFTNNRFDVWLGAVKIYLFWFIWSEVEP